MNQSTAQTKPGRLSGLHPTSRLRLCMGLLLALLCSACVYHMPIRQGNILQQDKVKQLQVGMTKSQVQYLLGTPMANDPFQSGEWTYLYYEKSPDNDTSERILHLYFKNARLASIKGPRQLKGKRHTLEELGEQPETNAAPKTNSPGIPSGPHRRTGSPGGAGPLPSP